MYSLSSPIANYHNMDIGAIWICLFRVFFFSVSFPIFLSFTRFLSSILSYFSQCSYYLLRNSHMPKNVRPKYSHLYRAIKLQCAFACINYTLHNQNAHGHLALWNISSIITRRPNIMWLSICLRFFSLSVQSVIFCWCVRGYF